MTTKKSSVGLTTLNTFAKWKTRTENWRTMMDVSQIEKAGVAELRAECFRLRQGLFECFRLSGGDTDGDTSHVHIRSDIVHFATESVRELARDYDSAIGEIHSCHEREL